jgi:hypothetical protein
VQLLKAKYGTNNSLLQAKKGPGISYSWRSIVRGFQALQKGLIWRVGDGSQIKIWEDPWIANGVSRRPITPRGHVLLTKAEELLNPGSGTWDEDLIRDVFWEEDVRYILATPTNPGHDDFLAWHFDRKGLFSVKSAYHVLDDEKHQVKNQQKGESSSSVGEPNQSKAIWRKIWKLSCPPKVRHFIWRLARNSLAVRMNIRRCGVLLDTRYPVCNRFDEDGGHCFLKCKMIRHCWARLSLEPVRQMLLLKRSAWEVIEAVLGLEEDVCTKTVLLLWRWWSVRKQI